MHSSTATVVKDLVLVGGGHAHVLVLKRFGMRPIPGVRLTLIARDIDAPYSGMLPGFVAGHYSREQCHIDLRRLASFAGARLYHDEATGLDLSAKQVLCASRPPVRYDVVSLDIGSRPRQDDVPGASLYATAVKPIDRLIGRWEQLVERVLSREGSTRVGVVGGGAAGVELALAIQFRLQTEVVAAGRDPGLVTAGLVTMGEILPTFAPDVRRILMRILQERNVSVYLDREVVAVKPGQLLCANGAEMPFDEILWVTQAGAAPWLRASGLECDHSGFVKVRDTLQTVTDSAVFAAGDVANMVGHPRPKAGVFAVRHGKPLADNLRRVLLGKPLRPFRPQKQFLSLISVGNRYAIASRWGWAIEGVAMWRLKDWIDHRFMKQFDDLPKMAETLTVAPTPGLAGPEALKELSAMASRCGGCGAKVGHTVLSRVVGRLRPGVSKDVLIGLDAPDDAAVVRVPEGKVMVHTVDFFRSMIDDPYTFGQIAANHSLGDIFAMGAEPQTALAIATVPYGLETKMEDDLFQMMSGALRVLDGAGAALVGGHTSEGAELGLGFAVNGTASEDTLLRKGPMAPGDMLVLTKPIGTGTLFAADMRHAAKGRWIETALASMLLSSREAARCLQRFHATACTDVTGFGLIGHLVEMIKQSDVDVTLDLSTIPFLDGARDTVAAGIFSSLQPQNIRLRRAIANLESVSADPRFPLLFDPQTAGGLLAAVPGDCAAACVTELKTLGYPAAAVIGQVSPRSEQFAPVTVLG
ncbi:MAG: selenide, water dikinase SelD [Betaproteobacteria bacterium]|nr:selenide, water dikinase SelD [Betaproteobacteria bacterium]